MTDDLRPCPFCGGEANYGKGFDYDFICCVECGAGHMLFADMQKWDKEMAADAWNTRHQPASPVSNELKPLVDETAFDIAYPPIPEEGDFSKHFDHLLDRGYVWELVRKYEAAKQPAPANMDDASTREDEVHKANASVRIPSSANQQTDERTKSIEDFFKPIPMPHACPTCGGHVDKPIERESVAPINAMLLEALKDCVKGIDALRFYFSKYGDTSHPGMICSQNSLIAANKAIAAAEERMKP